MNSKEKGNSGELKAQNFLREHGYLILDRNWRTRTGEIDIICKKEDFLVFVEVKTLPNATSDMVEKVLNKNKQKRIIKTAKHFMLNNRQYSNCYLRFDVMLLDVPGFPQIYHVENAFME